MSLVERSDRYRKNYGRSYNPVAPNYERCCENVHDGGRWPSFHQCTRKRGHGPDGAYCKQHDPDARKRRDEEAAKRANEKWNNNRYQWSGRRFFEALQKIADGHNDARGLAQEVIEEFKKGEQQ